MHWTKSCGSSVKGLRERKRATGSQCHNTASYFGKLVVYLRTLWSYGHRTGVSVLHGVGPVALRHPRDAVFCTVWRFPLSDKQGCTWNFFPCPENKLETATQTGGTRWTVIHWVSSYTRQVMFYIGVIISDILSKLLLILVCIASCKSWLVFKTAAACQHERECLYNLSFQ